jgi:hypothetical protein
VPASRCPRVLWPPSVRGPSVRSSLTPQPTRLRQRSGKDRGKIVAVPRAAPRRVPSLSRTLGGSAWWLLTTQCLWDGAPPLGLDEFADLCQLRELGGGGVRSWRSSSATSPADALGCVGDRSDHRNPSPRASQPLPTALRVARRVRSLVEAVAQPVRLWPCSRVAVAGARHRRRGHRAARVADMCTTERGHVKACLALRRNEFHTATLQTGDRAGRRPATP